MPSTIKLPLIYTQKDLFWLIARLQLNTYLTTKASRSFETPKQIASSEAGEIIFESSAPDSELANAYNTFFENSALDPAWASVFDSAPFTLVDGTYEAKFDVFSRDSLANFLVQIIDLFQKECEHEFIEHLSEDERTIVFQREETQKIFSDILLMYSHSFVSKRKFSEDPETLVIYSFCSQLFEKFVSVSTATPNLETYCNAVRQKAKSISPFSGEEPYSGMIDITMLREKTVMEAQAAFTGSENFENSSLERFVAHITQKDIFFELKLFFNAASQSIAQTALSLLDLNVLENKLQALVTEVLILLINTFKENFPNPEVFSNGNHSLAERNNLIRNEMTKPLCDLAALYGKDQTLTAQFFSTIIAKAHGLLLTWSGKLVNTKDIYNTLLQQYLHQAPAVRRYSLQYFHRTPAVRRGSVDSSCDANNIPSSLTSIVIEAIPMHSMRSKTSEEILLLTKDYFIYFNAIPKELFLSTMGDLLSYMSYLDQGKALCAAAANFSTNPELLSTLTQLLCKIKPPVSSFLDENSVEVLIKNQLLAEKNLGIKNEMLLLNSSYLLVEKLYLIGMIAKGKTSAIDVFSNPPSKPSVNSLYLGFSILSTIRSKQDIDDLLPGLNTPSNSSTCTPTTLEVVYC